MPESKRPLKVFLCHASADKPKVRELYRTLKRRGVQPWLDAEDLIPGQNWEVEIPKALLSSDAIIICLTPNSVDKEGYVQKEIKFALDKAMEMPEGRIFIIPARLEECELPFSLKKYHAVELYEKVGYTKLMQSLKLRASQLERATVQLPRAGEITADVGKIVEEKRSPEPKEEKPENEIPKPPVEKIGVGGDVKESVIVSGSGNVINIGEQRKPEPEKPQPKKTKPPRKPNTTIVVALIGLVGTIIAALLGSPIIERWFSPARTATELATVTATLTSRPITPSHTVKPNLTPTRSFTSTATPLPTEITDAKGVQMVLIPSGRFSMGAGTDFNPYQDIYLNNYYIDYYEVTNAEYQECVLAGECDFPFNTKLGDLSYYGNKKYDLYPVVWVTKEDAEQYCASRSARLPTSAEWEKAARGVDLRTYPWGEEKDFIIRANGYGTDDGFEVTAPVGSFPLGVSPYGVFDMIGNVAEFVKDNEGTFFARGDGWNGGWYSFSYFSPVYSYSSIDSHYYGSGEINSWTGFRCVKDATP